MTHILHRQTGHDYPVAVGGQGILVQDANGKEYIDASGGAAVSCLGHSHPDVVAAMVAQLSKLEYAHSSFFTTRAAEDLADDLVAHAPDGIDHVLFVSGGSEAVEAALKLARQFFVERGESQRTHIIARQQSYHGVTLGALAVGGREWQRKPFAPLLIETRHVSPVYEYRERRADESPSEYGERLARELESTINQIGGRHVMAFVAETIVGATMGAVPPVPGYFKRVREICDGHDGHRQRARWWLRADRRAPGRERDFWTNRERLGRFSAQPHLYGPSARLRRGAGRAAGNPSR